MSYDLERAADLILVLMQLTIHDGDRAWKGFDWKIVNYLSERGLISDPRSKAKSVVLSEEGLARSREMFTEHLAPAV